MKRKDAMRWIKALRSGEYKQGTSLLKSKEGFCCLGVLCEINPKLELNYDFEIRQLNKFELPGYKKIGLETSIGRLGPFSPESKYLAALNDSGYTFDEIADVIQIEYVEGL